jgi:hypothetical protein
MRNPDARAGAAIAGAMLVALPVIELAFGSGSPQAVHAITTIFGIGLLAAAARAAA